MNNIPSNVELGDHSYFYGTCRGAGNKVIIGKYSSVAENVIFDCGFTHDTSMISTFPFKTMMLGCNNAFSNIKIKGDIIIGNDVTVGEGSFIMSGVKISNGAVIGCNSVVTRDVLPYEVVGGSPAKFLKHRFSYEIIQKLLAIKWWNWEKSKIVDNAYLLSSDRINEFIKLHYEG